jgi:anaerobic ribonucleoside-triphosphate reductase activating protein
MGRKRPIYFFCLGGDKVEFLCASIRDSTVDGYGLSKVIYFQGCRFNCKGCHNKELQSFSSGNIYTTEDFIEEFNRYKNFYDSVVFLGGEPLEQKEVVLEICQKLDTEKWLYTGYELDEIPQEIRDECDIIIAGRYKEELRTESFPASSNQIIIFRGDIVENPVDFRSWIRQAV